jgi:hypothetical protein
LDTLGEEPLMVFNFFLLRHRFSTLVNRNMLPREKYKGNAQIFAETGWEMASKSSWRFEQYLKSMGDYLGNA